MCTGIVTVATDVHGITDEDVNDKPGFGAIAKGLLHSIDGCDLCGFNLKRFDLKILHFEMLRAGHRLDLKHRAIIDAMEIFHHYERRDLGAAVIAPSQIP